MVDDLMVQRCVNAGISAESLRRIELEAGVDPVTIVLVLVAAQKNGWQPPKTHADVRFESRRSPVYSPFPSVLEGDKR